MAVIRTGSAVLRRILGRRLRLLRERAGHTLDSAAPLLDWPTSKLARIETAQQIVDVHGCNACHHEVIQTRTQDAPVQPLRAALYLRVSEDKTREALAVARQREDATALIERRGWLVAREFTDNW